MNSYGKFVVTSALLAIVIPLGTVNAAPPPGAGVLDVNVVNVPDVEIVGTPGVVIENDELNPVPVTVVGDSSGSITHLNVRVGELVSLESFCILNDNSSDNEFYYDRNGSSPFVIPAGYSFVVTDIIAKPACAIVAGDPDDFYLALVEGPQSARSYTIRLRGDEVVQYTLNGGIAYPSGNEPRPRNTAFSAERIEIQLLGYFVEGDALAPGAPRF